MAKKTYLARTPIDHDGERYEIGEPIELEDKQAAPLVACGAIGAPPAKEEKKPVK